MKSLKFISVKLFILIVFCTISIQVLFSDEIPYIQYKKPDGSIVTQPLTELKSITFANLNCYDRCQIVLNDSSKTVYDPNNIDKIYFDTIKQNIVFVTFVIGSDGVIHYINKEYSINTISYIKFYEFLENIYDGKRLTKILITIKGLTRTLINEVVDTTPNYENKKSDTTVYQDSVTLSVDNPEDCAGALIKDTSIFLRYYDYYEKYNPEYSKGTTDYKILITIDPIKKVIKSINLNNKLENQYKSGFSHIIHYNSENILEIQDIPYQLNQNGSIEVNNIEISFDKIISYQHTKGNSETYGGGAYRNTTTMSNYNSKNGKIIISLEFGWKDK